MWKVLLDLIVLCIAGFFNLTSANTNRCTNTELKSFTNANGKVEYYCEYVNGSNRIILLPGSEFTQKCYQCKCSMRGLQCCQSQLKRSPLARPPPAGCIIIQEGCSYRTVLDTDRKTDCISKQRTHTLKHNINPISIKSLQDNSQNTYFILSLKNKIVERQSKNMQEHYSMMKESNDIDTPDFSLFDYFTSAQNPSYPDSSKNPILPSSKNPQSDTHTVKTSNVNILATQATDSMNILSLLKSALELAGIDTSRLNSNTFPTPNSTSKDIPSGPSLNFSNRSSTTMAQETTRNNLQSGHTLTRNMKSDDKRGMMKGKLQLGSSGDKKVKFLDPTLGSFNPTINSAVRPNTGTLPEQPVKGINNFVNTPMNSLKHLNPSLINSQNINSWESDSSGSPLERRTGIDSRVPRMMISSESLWPGTTSGDNNRKSSHDLHSDWSLLDKSLSAHRTLEQHPHTANHGTSDNAIKNSSKSFINNTTGHVVWIPDTVIGSKDIQHTQSSSKSATDIINKVMLTDTNQLDKSIPKPKIANTKIKILADLLSTEPITRLHDNLATSSITSSSSNNVHFQKFGKSLQDNSAKSSLTLGSSNNVQSHIQESGKRLMDISAKSSLTPGSSNNVQSNLQEFGKRLIDNSAKSSLTPDSSNNVQSHFQEFGKMLIDNSAKSSLTPGSSNNVQSNLQEFGKRLIDNSAKSSLTPDSSNNVQSHFQEFGKMLIDNLAKSSLTPGSSNNVQSNLQEFGKRLIDNSAKSSLTPGSSNIVQGHFQEFGKELIDKSAKLSIASGPINSAQSHFREFGQRLLENSSKSSLTPGVNNNVRKHFQEFGKKLRGNIPKSPHTPGSINTVQRHFLEFGQRLQENTATPSLTPNSANNVQSHFQEFGKMLHNNSTTSSRTTDSSNYVQNLFPGVGKKIRKNPDSINNVKTSFQIIGKELQGNGTKHLITSSSIETKGLSTGSPRGLQDNTATSIDTLSISNLHGHIQDFGKVQHLFDSLELTSPSNFALYEALSQSGKQHKNVFLKSPKIGQSGSNMDILQLRQPESEQSGSNMDSLQLRQPNNGQSGSNMDSLQLRQPNNGQSGSNMDSLQLRQPKSGQSGSNMDSLQLRQPSNGQSGSNMDSLQLRQPKSGQSGSNMDSLQLRQPKSGQSGSNMDSLQWIQQFGHPFNSAIFNPFGNGIGEGIFELGENLIGPGISPHNIMGPNIGSGLAHSLIMPVEFQ